MLTVCIDNDSLEWGTPASSGYVAGRETEHHTRGGPNRRNIRWVETKHPHCFSFADWNKDTVHVDSDTCSRLSSSLLCSFFTLNEMKVSRGLLSGRLLDGHGPCMGDSMGGISMAATGAAMHHPPNSLVECDNVVQGKTCVPKCNSRYVGGAVPLLRLLPRAWGGLLPY